MQEDPLNVRILHALRDLIAGISIDEGYKHDLTDSVFLGRNVFGDSDPETMVSILEPPVEPDQIPSPDEAKELAGDWNLLIQGFVKDDKANPTEPAYRLLADVRAVLAKERARPGTSRVSSGKAVDLLDMDGAVTKIDFGRGVVRPPDEISSKAYFWLNITISITEDMANPYA